MAAVVRLDEVHVLPDRLLRPGAEGKLAPVGSADVGEAVAQAPHVLLDAVGRHLALDRAPEGAQELGIGEGLAEVGADDDGVRALTQARGDRGHQGTSGERRRAAAAEAS